MSVRILVGDCRSRLAELPDQSVHTCVTSPPYFGLRDYGHDGQIGLESTPEAFVAELVAVFREVRRVLRDDGTLWLNLGDSYNNFRVSTNGQSVHGGDARGKFIGRRPVDPILKEKDLIGIPWRVAFALQADGWYLRSDIIWHKPNPMPESVTDRPTKSHEYLFLLAKSERYYYDADAIKQEAKYPNDKRRPIGSEGAWQLDGRKRGENGGGVAYEHDTTKSNRRSVWTVPTKSFRGAHFATFPPDLIEPCVKAGCPSDGVVLDPFGGAGTTGLVADRLGRNAILCELNPTYAELAADRLRADGGMLMDVALDRRQVGP